MGKLMNISELEKIMTEVRAAQGHIDEARRMVEAATRAKTDQELVTVRFSALPVGAVFHAVRPHFHGTPIRWFKQNGTVVSNLSDSSRYSHQSFVDMAASGGLTEITEVGKVGGDG